MNYNTKCSEGVFSGITEEEFERLKEIEQEVAKEQEPQLSFKYVEPDEARAEESYVWINGEVGVSNEDIVILQRFMKEYPQYEPITIQFAETGDRPRRGAFGGSVIAISSEYFLEKSTRELADELLEDIEVQTRSRKRVIQQQQERKTNQSRKKRKT